MRETERGRERNRERVRERDEERKRKMMKERVYCSMFHNHGSHLSSSSR